MTEPTFTAEEIVTISLNTLEDYKSYIESAWEDEDESYLLREGARKFHDRLCEVFRDFAQRKVDNQVSKSGRQS